ncbi:MAG: TIGR02677 family protein [Bacillota bacterium]
MNEQQLKPIIEASYLTAGNAWRYRTILRYFYLQHEKLRYYLFPDEVFEYLKEKIHFESYTEEQLQQDLSQLVEWRNLIPRQDTGKVTTIQEFKKKKFRYQCTPYTVEFERMVQRLEQKGDSFGGSLEKNLFERLLEALTKFLQLKGEGNPEEFYALWDELFGYFKKLTENATDYLAHLESEKIEEMMMTEAFLVYKDAVTEYLRNFMTALQRTSLKIEALLGQVSSEYIEKAAQILTEHYLSIPRLDQVSTKEEIRQKYVDQWQGLQAWFLGHEGRVSDLIYLQNTTNETVRRMTRFAQRLGEKHHNFKSRKKDYLHLAQIFANCVDIQDAHRLSAGVFGLFHTRHIWAEENGTEDIYQEIWEIQPAEVILNPRVRTYREKTRPQAVITYPEEKKKMLEEYLLEKEAEKRLIDEIIENKRIVLNKINTTDPYVRKTLLNWIGKSMGNQLGFAKTQTGHRFKLSKLDNQTITIAWDDGILKMPNFVIEFLG